jgi:NADH-quinone oxidoreductase subunit N
MALLILDLFIKKGSRGILGYLAVLGLAAAAAQTLALAGSNASLFAGMFAVDGYSTFFKLLFYAAASLAILASMNYAGAEKLERGEYYALMMFSTSGMMLMASGTDLISIFLGIELMAMPVYILSGFMRGSLKSNEAALKYFLLGSFSSAILLYGIALMYGITGTTSLGGIAAFLQSGQYSHAALALSMVMVAAGFGFKVAAAPFHMWVPDVYEGAPTSVTAFMSAGPKVAAFAAFLRIFATALPSIHAEWSMVVATLAVLSMVVGNIVAISQTNIKRMLAYSSIAHAGYAMVGFVAGSREGLSSVMVYLLVYIFMNVGAFGVVMLLRKNGEAAEDIEDLAGLAKRKKLAAFAMLVFMFSLAGIPPTGGFIGKFYIFLAALHSGYLWLALIMVAMSAVSAFFYLRVIIVMYMREPEGEFDTKLSFPAFIALAAALVVTIYLGVNPSEVIRLAFDSVTTIL